MDVELTLPPQARFEDTETISEYVGFDYHAIGIFKTTDDTWVVSGKSGYPSHDEYIEQEYPTESAARKKAEEHLSQYSWEYHYIVVVDDQVPQDIIFRHGWETYRVLQSNVEGWVHGFHGDQEYHEGGSKDDAIKGAKEAVIENGYDKLLIESENGSVEQVWPNCFLQMPASPLNDS